MQNADQMPFITVFIWKSQIEIVWRVNGFGSWRRRTQNQLYCNKENAHKINNEYPVYLAMIIKFMFILYLKKQRIFIRMCFCARF